jgi:hypothetical protein
MVVVKLRRSTVQRCLLAAYYLFNAEYPKGATLENNLKIHGRSCIEWKLYGPLLEIDYILMLMS